GPLGSAFSRDDFRDTEVKDTDGDGLMEFIDAWGEPLQFYRWPIGYRSDSQKGFPDSVKIAQDIAYGVKPGPYTTVFEPRELDPLDPNNLLIAPSWWTTYNAGPGTAAVGKVGGAAVLFQSHFHTLVDPFADAGGPSPVSGTDATRSPYWDRS